MRTKNKNRNNITFPLQYLTRCDKNGCKVIVEMEKNILCTYLAVVMLGVVPVFTLQIKKFQNS